VGSSFRPGWDAWRVTEERSPAREAAAAAAVELIEPGMLLGLGSGRAVWRVVELIGERGLDVRAAVASERTDARAREAGIEVVPLDGAAELDLALDGADEVDPQLRLIKGGGGALLREKIVVAAARRFVVVAETPKFVERLGAPGGFRLPVEVARFGWRSTRRHLETLLPDAELRLREDDDPYVTDEGHFIVDCAIPEEADLDELGPALSVVPGVMEHGLFVGLAERALLGTPEGEVQSVVRSP
jgi:ribose 5-phosphate isomerase A